MPKEEPSPASEVLERLLAGRWIAGPRINDAVRVAKRFNAENVGAIINYLGESLTTKEDVNETCAVYNKAIRAIKFSKIKADISIKPTQIGLGISYRYALKNYLSIVNLAKKHGIFVWLDMEESDTIDNTIKMYYRSVGAGNTGICIQSYLKRSMEDSAEITKRSGVIRLVKGAYREPEQIAYQTRSEITENYYGIMRSLFRNSRKFMIATHDIGIIDEAMRLNKKYKRNIEFGMLNGIRNRDAVSIAHSGYNMVVYIPFGPNWFKYSVRRLREAGHASLLARSLLSRQRI